MNLPSRLFLRIVAKSPDVYLLKVVTLSIAFACTSLILLFSLNEFRYDRFHRDHESVFRVLQRHNADDWSGNRLTNRIPAEVVNELRGRPNEVIVSRVKAMKEVTLRSDRKALHSQKIHASDPGITQIFSFDILDGTTTAFNTRSAVLLTTSLADELFGTPNAAGKTIYLTTGTDTIQCTVAAVYRDFPKNSHEHFSCFLHFDEDDVRSLSFNPTEMGVYGRMVLGTGDDFSTHFNNSLTTTDITYRFQPIADIYFGVRVLGEDVIHGDSYSILILLFITALILVFALTSYINLTTLSLPDRSKELAIKKLAGTGRWQLQRAFMSESLVLVGGSLLVGIVLLAITSGWVQSLLSVDVVTLIRTGDASVLVILLGLFLMISVAPLFLTNKFAVATPTRLLSTDTITFPQFKRTILFLQLGISIFLIVASMVVRRQIQYSLLKEPGRNHDQVVYLPYPYGMTQEELADQRAVWKTYNPNILDVMATSQLPGRVHSREVGSKFYFMSVDRGFRDFFRLKMIAGSWFSANNGDSTFVINASGRALLTSSKDLLGVYEDFEKNFLQPEKPIKLNLAPTHHYNYLCVRILEVDVRETLAYLHRRFGSHAQFLDERFANWIAYQDKLNTLSAVLAVISGLLSCCAVYGLSISIVRDKLKPIAIHKLFGASTYNITRMLVREFAKQTLLAILFFGPFTYIVINEVLRGFVYATDFTWLDPIVPIAYCAFIIILLCGFQAVSLNRSDLTSALKA